MKITQVVAALIWREDKILICRRPANKARALLWEFPGGKVEAGETPEKALVREIKEELAADISVGKRLTTVEYDYPEFHLVMDCYLCSVDPHALKLLEHENAEWLTWRDFNKMDWMEADKKVVEAVKTFFKEAERKIM